MQTTDPTHAVPIHLDPVSLVLHASGPVFLVVWALVAAAAAVWIVTILKLLQLARLSAAERRFEGEAARAVTAAELFAMARRHGDAAGGRVILALAQHGGSPKVMEAVAKRALVTETQRAGALLPVLSSIAAAGPFVGLFGTVYGIMDAFLRIGQEKSASLPVVAPAIGEALIATEKVLFGEDDVTGSLERVLAENPRVQKEKELYIRADKNAHYGAVARVVAAARAAGVEGLNLLVEPEAEGGEKP